MPTATEAPERAAPIPKFRFSEPRHNLPGRKGIATAEDRFTIAFARSYFVQAPYIHRRSNRINLAMAREIPVNGYGIADLLAVAWKPSGESFPELEMFVNSAHPRTRAFECKLTHWRKAMTQAARYRFFAHQAIVVLPDPVCRRALPWLETFSKIKVGLWGFNVSTGRITVYHTPRPASPKSARYNVHAVNLVHRAATQALPIQ